MQKSRIYRHWRLWNTSDPKYCCRSERSFLRHSAGIGFQVPAGTNDSTGPASTNSLISKPLSVSWITLASSSSAARLLPVAVSVSQAIATDPRLGDGTGTPVFALAAHLRAGLQHRVAAIDSLKGSESSALVTSSRTTSHGPRLETESNAIGCCRLALPTGTPIPTHRLAWAGGVG